MLQAKEPIKRWRRAETVVLEPKIQNYYSNVPNPRQKVYILNTNTQETPT